MEFTSYIDHKKTIISDVLGKFLTDEAGSMSSVSALGQDGIRRLSAYALRGKLLRGVLVYLGRDISGSAPDDAATAPYAGAMELFQSGLLIHDDIMDRDEMRRGYASIHAQYAKLTAQKTGTADAHAAEALAICLGDTAFFLGYKLISQSPGNPDIQRNMCAVISGEITAVCAAQMSDVLNGISAQQPTEEDILRVYRYKTGRYSCGLPLIIGALLAGVPEKSIQKLWKLGESMGVIFQLTDDRLNLFGTPKETGKPVSSDIREGKWTLYRLLVTQRADGEQKRRLSAIFGNPAMSDEDADYVRSLTQTLGIDGEIRARIQTLRVQALEILAHIPSSAEWKSLMTDCIGMLAERTV